MLSGKENKLMVIVRQGAEWSGENRILIKKSEKRSLYFNVRKFRVQKVLRISLMTPQFAKLNGREKNILVDSRKLIPQGKYNFAKINSYKMN